MKNAANSCVTVYIEERVDCYDKIVGNDPDVRHILDQITVIIERLYKVLVQLNVPPSTLDLLSDLEDHIASLETEEIRAIAKAELNGAGIAVLLGLMCQKCKTFNQDEDGSGGQ